MIEIPNEQIEAYRTNIMAGGDVSLHVDVGYFLSWYAGAETGITLLLAVASQATDFDVFDALTSGMDMRTKIERLRKICKNKIVIGPNLAERLDYLNDKARPLRNRLSHSFIGVNVNKKNTYFAAGLANLPWKELDVKRPVGMPKKSQPHPIPASSLLGWGGWLSLFCIELSAALNHYFAEQEFEIMSPKTKVKRGV